MKPPIPTQPVEKKNNSRLSRLLPMGVALLGVLALAGLVAYQDWSVSPPPVNGAAAAGGAESSRAYMSHWWGDEMDGFNGALSPDELLRMMPSDEPMEGEPADLPAYVKQGSDPAPVRQAGFRRAANGIVEELAAWWAPGATIDRVQKFYRDAAVARGFSFVPPSPPHRMARPYSMEPGAPVPPMNSETPATRPARMRSRRNSQLFIRTIKRDNPADPPRTEMLVVRLWTDDTGVPKGAPGGAPGGVRVLLWYRYPTYNRHAPGGIDFGATTQP